MECPCQFAHQNRARRTNQQHEVRPHRRRHLCCYCLLWSQIGCRPEKKHCGWLKKISIKNIDLNFNEHCDWLNKKITLEFFLAACWLDVVLWKRIVFC